MRVNTVHGNGEVHTRGTTAAKREPLCGVEGKEESLRSANKERVETQERGFSGLV